ncbi:uncharacterized protein LOC110892758 [Helianthus annuus]|uniref:uncharacterized protein LOC110892758 n=1 Tax=Helianthus annuus TaxID=4232 RepID=UPI000B8F0744|nr:uncharacterized protein LOC110892758 [Helianthus annuus]
MEAVHGGRGRWGFLPLNLRFKGSWFSLVKEVEKRQVNGKSFFDLLSAKVRNGLTVKFWSDNWVGLTVLKDRWPKLYCLEKDKQCVVADRLIWDGSMWRFTPNWKHGLSTVEEISEMQDVDFLLNNSSLSSEVDRWFWGEDGNEPMSVASVKKWIRKGTEVLRDHSMIWESWVPNKVNLFIWRAEMDRIPTKEALIRIHVNIQDDSCALCNSATENVMHLFTGCYFACGVWSAVGIWCDIGPVMAFDFIDLLHVQDQSHRGKWAQKIIRVIVYITCWVVWKLRNERIFQGANPKVVDAVARIKSWPFLWLKNRSKYTCIEWKDWGRNPLYML